MVGTRIEYRILKAQALDHDQNILKMVKYITRKKKRVLRLALILRI